jgi:hypothetical protein
VTIFGPDISSYEAGLDLSKLADASFIIAKTTEGTYYTDADYQGWRRQAANLGKPFIWYHFLSGEDPHAQAQHTLANVGDIGLPGMLDAEPTGSFSPTLAQMIAYVDAAKAVGLHMRLIYLPRWYWQQIGSPGLGPLADRGLALVSSSYPGGTGSPSRLYPGDGAAGWQGYGGMDPLLYQYTNQATDGSKNEDYNAYRGTIAQLVADLQAPAAPPAPAPDPAPPTSTTEEEMPAFVTGEVKPGAGAVTVVLPPPANLGTAGWGNVWFSLGSDFGDAHVRVAIYTHQQGWSHIYDDVLVSSKDDRVNPFGGPLPAGVQKISIARRANPDVPLAWLVEAAAR